MPSPSRCARATNSDACWRWGFAATFFVYFFINIAMVTGLVPVVGVPLPLVSYGGTAMVTILVGFGLVMSVYIHRDVRLPRRAQTEEL